MFPLGFFNVKGAYKAAFVSAHRTQCIERIRLLEVEHRRIHSGTHIRS